MNATVGTAFFGQLPEIALNVAIAKKYGIKFDITPAEADAKRLYAQTPEGRRAECVCVHLCAALRDGLHKPRGAQKPPGARGCKAHAPA